jgi:hypothetical protein
VNRGQAAQAAIQSASRSLTVTSPDESKRYTPQFEREQTALLEDALSGYAAAILEAQPTISATDLRAALKAAYNPFSDWFDLVDVPQAWRSDLGGKQFVVIAWSLFRGGRAIPRSKGFVQALLNSQGHFVSAAIAGDEFDGRGLFIRRVQSRVAGEEWFLANGMRFGDTGARSNVVLYSFDGKQFMVKWSRVELSALQLTVGTDAIDLDYDVRKAPQFERRHERYGFTVAGLELIRRPGI